MQLPGMAVYIIRSRCIPPEITVCACLAAPTMASTGQAAMHSVQPMHACSSMNASSFWFGNPMGGIQRERAAPAIPPVADALLASRRTLVDLGAPFCNSRGIGFASIETALATLSLRQMASISAISGSFFMLHLSATPRRPIHIWTAQHSCNFAVPMGTPINKAAVYLNQARSRLDFFPSASAVP